MKLFTGTVLGDTYALTIVGVEATMTIANEDGHVTEQFIRTTADFIGGRIRDWNPADVRKTMVEDAREILRG